jgi:dienelactone hydrolase
MELVMGPFPTRERPPLDVQVLEETSLDGYKRRSITFAAGPGDRVPAYLMIPDRPNGAGVLALHPTGELGKGIVALGNHPNRNYAEELARRGYVVVAPDYPTMGDPQKDAYELGYASGTMKGIYNHSRAVDLLVSMPQVQAGRIAAIGHSLGGHNALFVGVFEPRVRAIVTSCGFNAFPKYKGGDLTGWSSAKYMPRIAANYGKDPRRMPFDFTEILAALAPRAVFISAPTGDDNFEVSGVKDCLRAARPVYELFQASNKLVAVHPDCGHDFPPEIREQAYRFLEQALK